jgi:hypothetical protein
MGERYEESKNSKIEGRKGRGRICRLNTSKLKKTLFP